jgi:D-alanyl-lipoteichoic acid acyltransferase DltB (MBOAT superfamily)
MIYSSYAFLLLLPPLVVWFYFLRSALGQNLLILLASIIFLAASNLWNLLPAFVVIVLVYAWFRLDARYSLGRRFLAIVIGLLVFQLAYLKYRSFIFDTFDIVLPIPAALAMLIPLGISFYTFEAISAVVDIKRRKQLVPPTSMNWPLFIMFFPHLIAGPIVRWRLLAPQFDAVKKLHWRYINIGLHLFTIGFIKKLAADPLGDLIDPVWAAPGQANWSAFVLALLGFYTQNYLDFSGYTDMGRGVARMLGFRLPINFRAPFFAYSPVDFYQRWHVSLSSWIRIFLYDTLAVAVFRRVRGRTRQNLALFGVIIFVMAIFGLWHGSAWHFVLFGVTQGLIISAWAATTKGRAPRTNIGWLASVLLLQLTWLFSLIFFRADSVPSAIEFIGALARQRQGSDPALLWCLVATGGTLLVQAVEYYVRSRPVARMLCAIRNTATGACVVILVFAGALVLKMAIDAHTIAVQDSAGGDLSRPFIYFRF